MNPLITGCEAEALMKKKKNTFFKQRFKTRGPQNQILSNTHRRTYIDSSQSLPKNEEKGTVLKTFYEATSILIPKPDLILRLSNNLL